MSQHREAWAEPGGRVTLSLPTSTGNDITITMSAAQADQCVTDLVSAVLDAQQQTPDVG